MEAEQNQNLYINKNESEAFKLKTMNEHVYDNRVPSEYVKVGIDTRPGKKPKVINKNLVFN